LLRLHEQMTIATPSVGFMGKVTQCYIPSP
jgi:hypothetical protein